MPMWVREKVQTLLWQISANDYKLEIRFIYEEVIFVDFEVKKQLEAARKILEDLRESL